MHTTTATGMIGRSARTRSSGARHARARLVALAHGTALFAVTSVCLTAHAQDAGEVLLILDGSGSMWAESDGEIKVVAARRLVGELLTELPAGLDLGLMVYGHRRKGDCADIELLAAPGEVECDDMGRRLEALSPKGMTPIAGALKSAGELLRETESAATVVLVSDGIESCGGDPCAVAGSLVERSVDLTVHVVGYDVDEAAGNQLSCIAERGGGSYFSADGTDGLRDALASVEQEIAADEPVVTVIEVAIAEVRLAPEVIGGVDLVDADGGERTVRLTGTTRHQVPPGVYTLVHPTFTMDDVRIAPNETRVFTTR